ncbi:hypothetical protein PAT3040_05269 [Paenibacillus agaridevorans]|uniref:ABC transporter substrate-binding protein n=1 Tax=Paenibacillus agaridevorans TaxID=171404 RepID=A0A2R5EV01_9BACL|nr:extracellular solute-binding protein [Paenibacillus agaridevorans]GBG10526.1 hypothetical protein PAT3040_05269 [Paenibacillus agaridevorans]
MKLKAVTAILLVASLLAACSGNKSQSENPSESPSNAPSPSASADPVKIEVMQEGSVTSADGPGFPKDDFVKKELNKKLNIDLTMTLEASEFATKINTRMAGGTPPDLMLISKDQIQSYAKNGVLLDLGPYLDKLGDYSEFVGADEVKKGVVAGKQYALPRTNGLEVGTYWIRKDWLDHLKLSPPTTVEELFNVAKAFTENDPDGNGKKDTFGITGNGISTFSPLFGAFGVTPGTTALGGSTESAPVSILKDGKVGNALYDPAMKDALTEVKKFIDAGVVDPEFLSNKGNTAKDKAFQGKFGIIYDGWSGMIKEAAVKVWKEANPNADWAQLAAPKGPNGLQFAGIDDLGPSYNLLALPKTLEKQPEKLNKIIELLNYVSTTEGNRLVDYGLENVHYTASGDTITITEQGKKENGYTFVYQFTGRPELTYLQTKFPDQADYINFEAELPRLPVVDKLVDIPEGYMKADADRFVQEQLTNFMYGKTPIAEYDKFLETLENTFSYKLYTDSVEKTVAELGLEK